jgi:hypothetical protein
VTIFGLVRWCTPGMILLARKKRFLLLGLEGPLAGVANCLQVGERTRLITNKWSRSVTEHRGFLLTVGFQKGHSFRSVAHCGPERSFITLLAEGEFLRCLTQITPSRGGIMENPTSQPSKEDLKQLLLCVLDRLQKDVQRPEPPKARKQPRE